MLLYLLALKTTKATSKSFKTILTQTPISMVFFYGKQCPPCNRINAILDNLVDKYASRIRMVTVDASTNNELTKKYNISFIPSILIFRGDKFAGYYDGEWTSPSITSICENLLSADIHFIRSSFDYFRFKSQKPANLLISKSEHLSKAESLLDQYGGMVHIGLIDNVELPNQLNIPDLQFCRPMDEYCADLEEVDNDKVRVLMESPTNHLSNQELVGELPFQNSLVALFDESDPRHIHDVAKLYSHVREFFGSNLSYQTIDFMKAQNYVNQLQIVSFLHPIFLYISKEGQKNKIIIFQRLLPQPDDLLNWLKQLILHIEPPTPKTKINVPRMYADDFIQHALDPTMDVILLVASPGMRGYKEAKQIFQIMVQLFEPYKDKIGLWEFDYSTEHVQGLSMTQSDSPQISVWPATPEKLGSTFTALASLPVILDNLVQILKTEFTQQDVEEMASRLQEILQIIE